MKSVWICLLLTVFFCSRPSLASAPSDVAQKESSLPKIKLTDFQWVTSRKDLDPRVHIQASSNNVSIVRFNNRLYFGFRTSGDHFVSDQTALYILSSGDEGATWTYETEIEMGSDIREPLFLELNGHLYFYFFQAGHRRFAFEPQTVFRIERLKDGTWSKAVDTGMTGEVPWEIKVHKNVAYMTSYRGPHYQFQPGVLQVMFKSSTDGIHWKTLNASPDGVVYEGGVCEVAFEFDAHDNLWGVTRNEDGDQSGFGSHVIFAQAGHLGEWKFPDHADNERYDSPRMLSARGELFLISRRDLGGPFNLHLPLVSFNFQRWFNLITYSLRRKRTALFNLNRETRALEWMQDLPSTGDNAYPSVADAADGSIWVANYTSPLDNLGWTWLRGQLSQQGTSLYLIKMHP